MWAWSCFEWPSGPRTFGELAGGPFNSLGEGFGWWVLVVAWRVLVSVDAEGMPFVPFRGMLSPGDPLYGELRWVMTEVTNVVVGELFEAGARSVIVADSHGSMVNIDPRSLDPRASLVRGFPRPLSMLSGAGESDAAVFLGYHTCPDTGGVLAHTMAGRIIERVSVAGEEAASEFLLNALALGEMGKPVIMVAGDALLQGQVKRHAPWAVFVPLKTPVSSLADHTPPLRDVKRMLRDAARRAMRLLDEGVPEPLEPREPWIELLLKRPWHADVASLMPCVRRLGGVRVRLECPSFGENYKLMEAIILASYSLERR